MNPSLVFKAEVHELDCGQIHVHVKGPWREENGKVYVTCCSDACWCQPKRQPVARYVVGFLFVDGVNTVLLIRKKRPAWQAGRLNGPGGKVEPGETFLQAMRREFTEEIEYAGIDAWEHFATLHAVSPDAAQIAFFRAVITPREAPHVIHPHLEYDERPEWVRTDPLPDAVLPNLHFLIPMAREICVEINVEQKVVRVDPPEGLLDL